MAMAEEYTFCLIQGHWCIVVYKVSSSTALAIFLSRNATVSLTWRDRRVKPGVGQFRLFQATAQSRYFELFGLVRNYI